MPVIWANLQEKEFTAEERASACKRLNEKLIEQPNFAPSLQRKPGHAGLYVASNA
jgi:hypothetical protein